MRIYLPILLLATFACAQDRVDLNVVHQIRTEAFDNSKVMDTLWRLSDVYGPRLTASPEIREAADWAAKTLEGYGLSNVHQEKWGPFGRPWSARQYWVEMNAPRYAQLGTAPLAWSKSTDGPVSGDVIYAPLGGTARTLDPKKYRAQIDAWETKYKGALRGKIVLLTRVQRIAPLDKPEFVRYTDAELADLARAPEPRARIQVDLEHLDVPDDTTEAREYMMSLPPEVREQLFEARDAVRAKLNQFLLDEGVLAVITTDQRAHMGILAAEQAGGYDPKYPMAPPTFVLTAEQYNRLARLAEKNIPEKITVDLKAETSDTPVDSFNIIGEIPGGAKKDEVVMIGGHFDSWHSATGATDNGAGSAVMMDVMRVLKALNLKMDRTVRIGLWTGEEEGLLGSKAYVKAHFGDPDTLKITDEHAKLSGYFNLDNGTGRIRGVYLQGNDAMRPLFEQWLAPFRDLGASTITIRNTGGTDHLSFDAVGLPGFQFIQDPLDYERVTHHTSLDTYDHAQAADLMQAVAVIASVVYDAAKRPEMLPRKPLPKAKEATR
ncbi:MAG: M28 family peptidase [Bryobacteraceae bacterium]|jgi:hypothetical protein